MTGDTGSGTPSSSKSGASSRRNELLKLAREVPELRKHLIPMIRKTAMVFDTDEALKKYLKEHPGADRSRHTVNKTEGGQTRNSPGKKLVSILKSVKNRVTSALAKPSDEVKDSARECRKALKDLMEAEKKADKAKAKGVKDDTYRLKKRAAGKAIRFGKFLFAAPATTLPVGAGMGIAYGGGLLIETGHPAAQVLGGIVGLVGAATTIAGAMAIHLFSDYISERLDQEDQEERTNVQRDSIQWVEKERKDTAEAVKAAEDRLRAALDAYTDAAASESYGKTAAENSLDKSSKELVDALMNLIEVEPRVVSVVTSLMNDNGDLDENKVMSLLNKYDHRA